MFFEEDNCRALKLLHEAGNFLEASLEKLLALEQEVVLEMKENEKTKIHDNVNCGSEKLSLVKNKEKIDNLKLGELDTVSDNIDGLCDCSSEACDHKCALLSQKVRSSLTSQHSPPSTPGVLKRKYDATELNDDISSDTSSVEKKKEVQPDPKAFVQNTKTSFVEKKKELKPDPKAFVQNIKTSFVEKKNEFQPDPKAFVQNIKTSFVGKKNELQPDPKAFVQNMKTSFVEKKQELQPDPKVLVQNIKIENELDGPIETNTFELEETVSNNSNNYEVIKHCQALTVSQSKKVTLLEEYFKVYIKFKESFPYETVEELIRSVGLDDIFDIVLTKKKAEVTFLNENSMKKALNLSKTALCKLKAYIILPVKKPKFN